jgi:tetrahydromethanopterin S-methyltransferase subunit F
MIESPETEAYVPVGVLDPETEAPPAYAPTTPKPANGVTGEEDDGDVLLVRNKPVTSSLRQTIHHLRLRAGYLSRFRGLSMYLIWNMASGFLVGIMGGAMRSRSVVALAAIVAETLLSTLHMAWVHIVISEASQKKWYQRIPSFKTWPKIAPAVALWATTNQVVSILPMLVTGSFGSLKHMHNPTYEPDQKDLYAIGAQGFLAMVLMLLLFLLLQIPASVTLVRVAASMLPEEDETIVPFDRTFGGKTTPAIVGGQGKIGLVEAWRSFPWDSRVRLVKLMAKVALVAISCWVLFTIVMVAEAHLLFGDSLGDMMKTMHGIAGPR